MSESGLKFSQAARASPLMFTPGFVKKLSSSVAIVAARKASEMVSIFTGGLEAEPVEGGNTPDKARADIPAETLKKAMRAFRRRIKLIRLDHESRLGVGPMTGGRKADFDAILPPQEFASRVWEKLAETGQLRNAGQGFYMLAEGDPGG